MERLMEKLCRQKDKPTRLIIDGLDECEVPTEDDKSMWSTFFETLAQLPSQWKVLIISRPNNWYNELLESKLGNIMKQKTITSDDNFDDLHEFAMHQVETYAAHRKWPQDLKTRTLQLIFDKAEGNMMWVYLLCEMFARAKPKQIESMLDKPPKGLGGLYGRALEGLSDEDEALADDVRTALKWILCSYRPVRLAELECILSMSSEAVKDDIFKFIGPLIKVDGSASEIRLVHASARDYLISEEATVFNQGSTSVLDELSAIHASILLECLEYLSDEERKYVQVGPNQDASEGRFKEVLKNDALLEYSCNGWIQHLVQASRSPKVLESVKPQLEAFFASENAVVKWLQMFHYLWNVHAPSDAARNHLGALTYHPKGTHDWADFLMDIYPDFVKHLGWEDGGRYTRWDRFMHKRHNYDVHHPFSMYQSPKVLPSISVAAMFDYDQEVKSLIATGVNVDHKGPLDGTALHWAAAGGSCKSIEVLLDAGANKEARYGRHRETPIFRGVRVPKAVPVRPGQFPAARMLFDKDVSLEHEPISNGFHVSTVLIALVEEGPDCEGAAEFAKVLCARDPVFDGWYMRLGNILQCAAWHNRQLILEELLRHSQLRSRINEQDSGTRLRTVLHDACTQDNPAIAKILLQAGADPNVRCILNGYSPLHFSVCAKGKTVGLLLDHDPPAKPSQTEEIRGWPEGLAGKEGKFTPAHLAVWTSNEVDFAKFVAKGFDIDQVDGNGDSALTTALENNLFDIAKSLLKLGAKRERIPRKLRIYLPTQERDERLLQIRADETHAKHWQPLESYAYLFFFRLASGRQIPIPVFDHILRLAGHLDVIQMSRRGRMEVNEHITQQIPRSYLMSPPIQGNAKAPVRRVEMYVHSRDQGYANQGIDYSLSQLVTINHNMKIVHWQPDHKFGRNRHHWQDHRQVLNKKGKKSIRIAQVGHQLTSPRRPSPYGKGATR